MVVDAVSDAHAATPRSQVLDWIIDDPGATLAETGVNAALLTEFQKRPVSVLPGTSCPELDAEVLVSVMVRVFPEMENLAEALTGTLPGPVPEPTKVTVSAEAFRAGRVASATQAAKR